MSFFQIPTIPWRSDIHKTITVSCKKMHNAGPEGDTGPGDTGPGDTGDTVINKTLMLYLTRIKTEIDNRQSEWDKFKKYTNPYEYIHTTIPNTSSSISKLKPLSRSYYKMLEMYHMFNLGGGLPSECRTFHIAEGPGGFIEAMCELRGVPTDTYVGITLIDDKNYSIPGWKKSRQFLDKHPNVEIESGKTGTGDIMCASNLKYCYEKYGGQIDLVTADGGFDFSVDFNHQEAASAKLIFCQIAFAVAVQKSGGNFLIKFFDTFTQVSLDMLFLLSLIYNDVYFVKPNTSRYANSEKYVVCKNFRLNAAERASLVDCFIKEYESFDGDRPITSILNVKVPYMYSCKVQEYNAIFGQQQIETISTTLNLIDTSKHDRLENMKKSNLQKCVLWCQKHGVPHISVPVNSNVFLTKGKG